MHEQSFRGAHFFLLINAGA